MKWYSTNLNKPDAMAFRQFLIKHQINFETSGNGNLVHFEVEVDNTGRLLCNDFLNDLN